MRALRAHTSRTSWILALVMLLASLAPSLSHGLGAAKGAAWIEVCTAQGAQWIQVDEGRSEPAPAAAHPLDHCPYCSLHAQVPGLPPAATSSALLLSLGHALPLAFLAAPRTLHAWLSALPRAPPSFS